MTLLDECVKILGDDTEILEGHDKKAIVKKLRKKAPLKADGRVDWEDDEDVVDLKHEYELEKFCEDGDYYIVWDNEQLPVVMASLSDITKDENIHSIMDVSFDTWLISEDFTNVVEIDRNRVIKYKKFIEPNEEDGFDKKDIGKNIFFVLLMLVIAAILIGLIHIKYGS